MVQKLNNYFLRIDIEIKGLKEPKTKSKNTSFNIRIIDE